MNYNDKKFRPISNTENGETSIETLFHYKQVGNILTSEYSGGKIKNGHLIGLVNASGKIEMRYHQVNDQDELMTGICISTPEILENGKIAGMGTTDQFMRAQSDRTVAAEIVRNAASAQAGREAAPPVQPSRDAPMASGSAAIKLAE